MTLAGEDTNFGFFLPDLSQNTENRDPENKKGPNRDPQSKKGPYRNMVPKMWTLFGTVEEVEEEEDEDEKNRVVVGINRNRDPEK